MINTKLNNLLNIKFGNKSSEIIKIIEKLKLQSEDDYRDVIYHIINEKTNQNILDCSIGINHQVFNEFKTIEKEENDFITNPMVVEEGVFECPKCSSKRTMSWGKQTRSGDEGTSVFAKCIQCNNNWRIS